MCNARAKLLFAFNCLRIVGCPPKLIGLLWVSNHPGGSPYLKTSPIQAQVPGRQGGHLLHVDYTSFSGPSAGEATEPSWIFGQLISGWPSFSPQGKPGNLSRTCQTPQKTRTSDCFCQRYSSFENQLSRLKVSVRGGAAQEHPGSAGSLVERSKRVPAFCVFGPRADLEMAAFLTASWNRSVKQPIPKGCPIV